MHGLISRLVAQHSVETCEAALVSAFLHDAGLRVRRNRALVGLLEAAPGDTSVAMSLIRSERRLDLDDLVFAFEALIPASERRNHGTVFTPRPIAEYLAERTITANTTSILDPSCGCGALLMAAARRAAAITGRSLAEVATEHLHGVDLRADNIRRARLLLGLMCLHAGEDTPDAGTHLAVGNSLTFEYAAAFPRMQAAGGFSAIVGNPPYVRFQDLDDATRRQLSAWPGGADGNPNLYFAFFPLGRSLLAPTGRLAYISPNSFFHLRSARGLRTWLGDTGFVHEVIDFGDTLVFDALAYTAITICAPTPARTVTYRTESDPERLADHRSGEPVAARDLTPTRWRFRTGTSGRLLERLESAAALTIGDVADIRGGIATLRDRLFFVDGAGDHEQIRRLHDGREYLIERATTRACVRISDFPDANSLAGNTRRVIYPYRLGADGRPQIIAESELHDQYPGAYEYLCAIRPQLAERDRGAKRYPAWYAYGRSQGLIPPGPALLYPLYGREPRFLPDATPKRLICNGQALTVRADAPDGWSLALLGALLHRSPVLRFIMANTANKIAGGYWTYSRVLISAVPLPTLTADEASALLGASEQDRPVFICDAYRLSVAERTLVLAADDA